MQLFVYLFIFVSLGLLSYFTSYSRDVISEPEQTVNQLANIF